MSMYERYKAGFERKEKLRSVLEASVDDVNHPAHYTYTPIEVIDIIEGFKLNFHLGNVIKYILRAGHKGEAIKDLQKAKWYLDRYIANQSQKEAKPED